MALSGLNTLSFSDLNCGDLFMCELAGANHIMMKAGSPEGEEPMRYCAVILSPTYQDFRNEPGLFEGGVVNHLPLLHLTDWKWQIEPELTTVKL